jgi:hydrogenase maturation protease
LTQPRIRGLIIGFGNPLRSDDGIGWHIAQRLSRELLRDDIQVIAAQQLTPEMAEIASRAERVLFVDAAPQGQPGTVHCQLVAPSPALNNFTHELSPASVLNLAQDLYGRCPSAHLFTVAGETFGTGDTMSPAVVAVVPALVAHLISLVDSDTMAP